MATVTRGDLTEAVHEEVGLSRLDRRQPKRCYGHENAERLAGRTCVSVTVTVALAVFASAVPGVPLIAPVVLSMPSPGGRPVAP